MRIVTFALILCALLSGAAIASPVGLQNSSGELLTVRVEGLPSSVDKAICDLGPELQGLELRQEGSAWTGSFAVLPNLVSDASRPQVHAYDDGRAQSLEGATVELASSTFDSAGLADVLADREVRFVFGDQADANSICLMTRDGLVTPDFEGNTFTLPNGVTPMTVSAIAARTVDGSPMVFMPDWTNADLATVEEEF